MRVNDRNVLGTLLHLPRFYSQKLPKLLVLIKRTVQILKVILPDNRFAEKHSLLLRFLHPHTGIRAIVSIGLQYIKS